MASRWTLIAGAAILVIGIPGAIWWNTAEKAVTTYKQVITSDAAKMKGTIKVGTDNFIGYGPLCGPYLRALMLAEGYNLVCNDDGADYPKRMQKLANKELDLAVATIDSYELNALPVSYPGSIAMIIDVSQGADAIVSCKAEIKNVEDLKKGGLKFGFVFGSPSEYLLKGNATNFDIPQLRDAKDTSWRVEAKSSPDARKKCAAGIIDAAVLWEPDVTKLLRSNPQTTKKLMGTENTSRFIVDVLVARRDFAKNNPEVMKTLMRHYFETLLYYRNNPETAAAHAAEYVNANAPSADAKITAEEAKIAMKGVAWASLGENALLWFGVAEPGQQRQFGLVEAIQSTTRMLIENGDLQKNPFPNGDWTSIVQSEFITELYQSGMVAKDQVDLKAGDSLGREFSELSDDGWKALREVGTLKAPTRPITFQSGTETLSLEAKESIDRIVEMIKSYPNFRILIEGHTGTRGDTADNLQLSQDRAEAVARYFRVTYDVKQNRLHAVGYGGQKPLKKNFDESDRSYQGRLARVVVKLMMEAY